MRADDATERFEQRLHNRIVERVLARLRRFPSCQDPEHPGCPNCTDPLENLRQPEF